MASFIHILIPWKMDSNAIEFAEKALLADAVPDWIRKQLSIDFSVHVTAKFLQNIKHKVIGNYLCGT